MSSPDEVSPSRPAGTPSPQITREAFCGVSAFPLTPMLHGGARVAGASGAGTGNGGLGSGGAIESDSGSGTARAPSPVPARIDEVAFAQLIARAAEAGVASIGVLGSTGSYMYLNAAERARVIELAVQHAAGVPVLAGVSALATYEVLENVFAAESAGAAGLIVAPVSYQQLSDDEVLGLFQDVTEVASTPIVIYDNPATTGYRFSLDMYARVAALPGIASIKVPPPPAGLVPARAHIKAIRSVIPDHVTIGVSGDASAALGLMAGCDGWYSVIAGVLPEAAVRLAGDALAAAGGTGAGADAGTGVPTSPLDPLLALFSEFGSLRAASAVAQELGLVGRDPLPRPVQGLSRVARDRVREALRIRSLLLGMHASNPRERLEAVMAVGSAPAPSQVAPLLDRLGSEPDFQVREMLTWAIVRHHEEAGATGNGVSIGGDVGSAGIAGEVLPRLLAELKSQSPIARAQSLHTLTKLGAHDIWERVTPELLHDPDQEVARTAWRAAALMWPEAERSRLARELTQELGRGDLEVLRSLARAFVEMGDHARPSLEVASLSADSRARAHAEATLRLCEDPESTFWMEPS